MHFLLPKVTKIDPQKRPGRASDTTKYEVIDVRKLLDTVFYEVSATLGVHGAPKFPRAHLNALDFYDMPKTLVFLEPQTHF